MCERPGRRREGLAGLGEKAGIDRHKAFSAVPERLEMSEGGVEKRRERGGHDRTGRERTFGEALLARGVEAMGEP